MHKRRHKYIPNPSNLFEDNHEEDQVVNARSTVSFRSRFPPPQRKPTPCYMEHDEELQRQKQLISEKQREIEKRTLDSSSRCLGLLQDSEQIGITAAEELVCQHETLNKTNKRLDEMNPKLNNSQKHLNGINSIFYSVKNYLSGKSDSSHPCSQESHSERKSSPSSSKLNKTLDQLSQRSETDSYKSHPSTRLRDVDQQVQSEPITDSQRVNNKLQSNLQEMGPVIARLKNLGVALGEEIDEQNKLIDNIQVKVEDVDIKIGNQMKTMNKILGK